MHGKEGSDGTTSARCCAEHGESEGQSMGSARFWDDEESVEGDEADEDSNGMFCSHSSNSVSDELMRCYV